MFFRICPKALGIFLSKRFINSHILLIILICSVKFCHLSRSVPVKSSIYYTSSGNCNLLKFMIYLVSVPIYVISPIAWIIHTTFTYPRHGFYIPIFRRFSKGVDKNAGQQKNPSKELAKTLNKPFLIIIISSFFLRFYHKLMNKCTVSPPQSIALCQP